MIINRVIGKASMGMAFGQRRETVIEMSELSLKAFRAWGWDGSLKRRAYVINVHCWLAVGSLATVLCFLYRVFFYKLMAT